MPLRPRGTPPIPPTPLSFALTNAYYTTPHGDEWHLPLIALRPNPKTPSDSLPCVSRLNVYALRMQMNDLILRLQVLFVRLKGGR